MKIKLLFILFGTLTLGAATQASAADGCKFMLCLGAIEPLKIAQCASTVDEVLKILKKGETLPSCKMKDGSDSRQSGDYVDYVRATLTPRCPKGMKQGQDGVVYHVGKLGDTNSTDGVSNRFTNDNNLFAPSKDRYIQRICLGGLEAASLPATYANPPQKWYQSLQIMKPDGADYEFSFFLNGELYKTHRF